MEPTDIRRGVILSRATRRQAIGLFCALGLIFAAYLATGSLVGHLPVDSAGWFWLDLPSFALLACVLAVYAKWRGEQREVAVRWQADARICEIAGASCEGTWEVMGKSLQRVSEWTVAVVFLAAIAVGMAALGVWELAHSHHVRDMAQGIQMLCDASGPSVLILLNWPFRARRFRYVVTLRRGTERMRVLT
ncbi:hypothetical protein [Alicyclobacillus sendaiensis]|uniref:Uncharacterized protein n=1 Tax=Alicyclobacillus sendaiensis PA2 TaxID=3029425 RepID=A0ABT6XV90_ALISE|nr:hypothetical protein [Alicyclobacillus sendaiensis]MDI9258922.1 hypothetical protein [Alicyclobacillus sendaiensis PA2]